MSSFEIFEKKYNLWKKCLSGDDFHSIGSQISRMMWNAAVWRFINQCRKIAPPSPEGGVQLNGMTHQLIDECFVESQFLAIRRLTDSSHEIEDEESREDRSVYSLISLLEDIKNNSVLTTRSNFFRIENLEYDRTKAWENFPETQSKLAGSSNSGSFSAYILPTDRDPFIVDKRHEQFDFLSGVNSSSRSQEDSIRKDLLENLINRVKEHPKKINDYVNKFIAHSATPQSRNVRAADNISTTDLWKSQETICKISSFLNSYLFKTTLMRSIPTAQFNEFKYIDHPLVTEENLDKLKNMWNEFEIESKNWTNWNTPEFLENL